MTIARIIDRIQKQNYIQHTNIYKSLQRTYILYFVLLVLLLNDL